VAGEQDERVDPPSGTQLLLPNGVARIHEVDRRD